MINWYDEAICVLQVTTRLIIEHQLCTFSPASSCLRQGSFVMPLCLILIYSTNVTIVMWSGEILCHAGGSMILLNRQSTHSWRSWLSVWLILQRHPYCKKPSSSEQKLLWTSHKKATPCLTSCTKETLHYDCKVCCGCIYYLWKFSAPTVFKPHKRHEGSVSPRCHVATRKNESFKCDSESWSLIGKVSSSWSGFNINDLFPHNVKDRWISSCFHSSVN